MATSTAQRADSQAETTLQTVMEVAKQLRVSRSKIYTMMDAGDLAYVKLGKSRRVPRSAVNELIERSLVRR